MEQLVKVTNGQVCIAEEVLEEFHNFKIMQDKMKIKEKEIRKAILKAMSENGIKSFKNDFVTITYKAPYTKQVLDNDALKEQGLYDQFLKTAYYDESVSISWK